MDFAQEDIQAVARRKELFEAFRGKRVFVTGATGLIGSALVKVLLAADERYDLGMQVIGQVRNPEKAERIFGGKREKDFVTLVEGYDVDCDFIVHTVSPTSSKFFIEHPVETIKVSVGSAMSVLETANKCGSSMVYVSSMEEYGVPDKPGEVMTEDKVGIIDHLNIRSCYSESKRLCECLCASYAAEYGVNVSIARLAQTFGAVMMPGDNRMPAQFAGAAAEGKDIVLRTKGRSVSNFVYLTDAIAGILLLLSGGKKGEAYNICNDSETRSVYEIARLVAEQVAGGAIG
ncbi:MAG: NAD-dependent epimerase/dehydratase family protein, partial [bacterium]